MQITWCFLNRTSKDYADFINVITDMKNYQNVMNKLKMLSIQYVISVVFQTGIKKNTELHEFRLSLVFTFTGYFKCFQIRC